jgi:hypothetical protein
MDRGHGHVASSVNRVHGSTINVGQSSTDVKVLGSRKTKIGRLLTRTVAEPQKIASNVGTTTPREPEANANVFLFRQDAG